LGGSTSVRPGGRPGRSPGQPPKGPRLHDWCYRELADLEAEDFNDENHGLWTRGLLTRRDIADGDLAYFTTWCPAGTSITTLVNLEGHRWAIEDSFETAKNEFGLDHNETRSWHGWHRHVWLVMLALAAIRHQANRQIPKKSSSRLQEFPNAHPLVDPGNPPDSPAPRAKTHQPSLHHRLVTVAPRPPSRRSESSYQI